MKWFLPSLIFDPMEPADRARHERDREERDEREELTAAIDQLETEVKMLRAEVDLLKRQRDERMSRAAGLALIEEARRWERVYLRERDRLDALREAAFALYERVEMDESVGICLSDRVPSLKLGQLLREQA